LNKNAKLYLDKKKKQSNSFKLENNIESNICSKKKFLYLCIPFQKETLKILSIMAKKGNRIQVILECTEHKESGVPGMSRYITTKNRKNTTARIELRKYNSVLKKVTLHKEIK
jgi:large subunit ribosomal protein L33